MLLTIEQAVAMLTSLSVEASTTAIEVDHQTRGAASAQKQYISDRTFFGLLGVKSVLAIDCSNYEGAEIILDLNHPIPASHRGTIDFLFGGSVLDNIFDPANYLSNISELLRPGGRLIEQDIISQHNHPYCLVTPSWMFDYFIANEYAAFWLYITEYAASGFVHVYGLDPDPDDVVSDFGPPRGGLPTGVVAIAEKGPLSTSHARPIQDQYRAAAEHEHYRRQLSVMGHREFFEFDEPTQIELRRLDRRTSRSFRYLGVIRPANTPPRDVEAPRVGSKTPTRLRIFQATYGANYAGATLHKSGVSAIYTGNVTEILASMFNETEQVEWIVDVNVLGDPAPHLPKDLEIFYSDLSEEPPRLRRAYIPPEASGQLLNLPLPD